MNQEYEATVVEMKNMNQEFDSRLTSLESKVRDDIDDNLQAYDLIYNHTFKCGILDDDSN